MCEILFKNKTERQPKYLFKYFNNVNYVLDALQNKHIHLETPNKYNDIFDGAFVPQESSLYMVNFNYNSLQALFYLIGSNVQDYHLDESFFVDCKNFYEAFNVLSKRSVNEKIVQSLKIGLIQCLKNFKESRYKISCFSEVCDSTLMWAHYGQSLEGFCLIFDADLDNSLFANLHKIDYKLNRVMDPLNNFNIYFTKSLDWSYEQEWRFVVETEKEYIDTKSCIGIIFGEKNRLFHQIVNGKNVLSKEEKYLIQVCNKYQVFRAVASSQKYQINIEELDSKYLTIWDEKKFNKMKNTILGHN